ncbi:MAG TPA: hypothetical protein VF746_10440 [Longimicrobium sp.]|jgi:hypothetical protein
MAKLRLDLDALKVESFEALCEGLHVPGTVRANQDAGDRAGDAADAARDAATNAGPTCAPSNCSACGTCYERNCA